MQEAFNAIDVPLEYEDKLFKGDSLILQLSKNKYPGGGEIKKPAPRLKRKKVYIVKQPGGQGKYPDVVLFYLYNTNAQKTYFKILFIEAKNGTVMFNNTPPKRGIPNLYVFGRYFVSGKCFSNDADTENLTTYEDDMDTLRKRYATDWENSRFTPTPRTVTEVKKSRPNIVKWPILAVLNATLNGSTDAPWKTSENVTEYIGVDGKEVHTQSEARIWTNAERSRLKEEEEERGGNAAMSINTGFVRESITAFMYYLPLLEQ